MRAFLLERLFVALIFAAIFGGWYLLTLGGFAIHASVPFVFAIIAWLAFIFIKARRR